MNATDIILIVEQQGAQIKLHGEGLEVVNGQSLPPETINLLKQHKSDILAYLSHTNRVIKPFEPTGLVLVNEVTTNSVSNINPHYILEDNTGEKFLDWLYCY